MKKIPLKKMLTVLGVCSVLLTTTAHAYEGVKTAEHVRYSHHGASYQKEEVEKIATGVDHIKISKLMPAGWVDIHLLRIDLKQPGLDVKTIRSNTWKKKETLKTMVDNSTESLFGAINGSYFAVKGDYSDSQGFEYADGLVHMDNLLRAGLFIDKQSQFFFSHAQKLGLYDAVTGEDLAMPIQIANNFPAADGIAIFNRFAYADSKVLDGAGEYYKVKVKDGVITEVVPPYSNATFDAEGYTLVFGASNQNYLQKAIKGRSVEVKTEAGISLDSLRLAIPGGGYVLQNGEVSLVGELVQPNRRHPRTAIGLTKDKKTLYFMVIDGRGGSIGATHYEMAGYLKELGVSDAIAMDGGGSSILMARNLGDAALNIENNLPQKHQRKLINGLAVYSTNTAGVPAKLIVTPKANKTFANVPVALEVRAVDANDLPVKVDSAQIYWELSGGTVQNGNFIGATAGIIEVTAHLGSGVKGKTSIEVTSTPIDLRANPYVLELEQGSTGRFELLGTDAKGFVGRIAAADATYKLEDETIGYFTGGVFTPSKKGGTSRVTITVGDRSTTAYIIAGAAVKSTPEIVNIPLTVSAEGATVSASMAGDFGFGDSKSLGIAYHFPTQEESEEPLAAKATLRYSVPIVIDKEAEKMSLRAYGAGDRIRLTMDLSDGSGQTYGVVLAENDLNGDWKAITRQLPADLKYPVQILGYTLQTTEPTANQAGYVYLDDLVLTSRLKIHTEVYQEYPNDALRRSFKRAADISLFGATAGKNRILDDIVMEKAIQWQQKAKTALYAGPTELTAGALRPGDVAWKNVYQSYELGKVKVIHLAAKDGSFQSADPAQFKKLAEDLTNTVRDNIIVVADVHPLEEKKHRRESAVIHEIVSRYALSSGKNVYYVAATGYQTGVTLKDGVRYLKTNGLWYHVKSKREIDLNRQFYQLNFNMENNILYYDIVNLYPLVE